MAYYDKDFQIEWYDETMQTIVKARTIGDVLRKMKELRLTLVNITYNHYPMPYFVFHCKQEPYQFDDELDE